MRIDQLKENENLEKSKRSEGKFNGKPEIAAEMDALSENNLKAKATMVTELVDMGFSLKAIERILRIKSKVLDRLL